MPKTPPTLLTARSLISIHGDKALDASRARLVERLAADDRAGALFWRRVLAECESELAGKDSGPGLPTSSAAPSPLGSLPAFKRSSAP